MAHEYKERFKGSPPSLCACKNADFEVTISLTLIHLVRQIHQFLHRHMTLEERQHYLGSGFSDFEVIYITDPSQDRGNASRRRRGADEEENLVLEAFGK